MGEGCCISLKAVSVAFFSSDTCCDSSFPPRCGVLITVNTRMVAGGCAWGSQGSNEGGQWPRAPGGWLVGGASLLLM